MAAGRTNTTVMLTDVDGCEPRRSAINLTANGAPRRRADFEHLVVAAGTQRTYSSHDEWAQHLFSPATLNQTLARRKGILVACRVGDDPPRCAHRCHNLDPMCAIGPVPRWTTPRSLASWVRCRASGVVDLCPRCSSLGGLTSSPRSPTGCGTLSISAAQSGSSCLTIRPHSVGHRPPTRSPSRQYHFDRHNQPEGAI